MNLHVLILFVVVTPSCFANSEPDLPRQIFLDIFTDSMSPSFIRFFREQFSPNYRTLVDVFSVRIAFFGHAKAKLTVDGGKALQTVECEHGERECRTNVWGICAQDVVRDVPLAVSFLECFLETVWTDQKTDVDVIGKKCAKMVKYPKPGKLFKCATGPAGLELHLSANEFTQLSLEKFKAIPTIKFDEKTISTKAVTDLMGAVCDLYEGKPKFCSLTIKPKVNRDTCDARSKDVPECLADETTTTNKLNPNPSK